MKTTADTVRPRRQPHDRVITPSAAEHPLPDLGLTERQVDVLALMMQGKSNKAICRALNLAEPTVKKYVTAILNALKVSSRTEAVIAVGKLSATKLEQVTPRVDSASWKGLPNKPSIVVLPFTDLSGDASQGYFAEGIVEDISIALGRFSWLFVIASSAVSVYKGRALDLLQVGMELGVRYALCGSIRKDSGRVRMSFSSQILPREPIFGPIKWRGSSTIFLTCRIASQARSWRRSPQPFGQSRSRARSTSQRKT
jgi:TolB-like protein/DNA-binding CsgD family transcriptional regulator